jgi:hypothetical protein
MQALLASPLICLDEMSIRLLSAAEKLMLSRVLAFNLLDYQEKNSPVNALEHINYF